MTDVIDEEAIAIAPAGHVEVVGGGPVIVPEGFVEEQITSAVIVGESKSMASDEKAEGLTEGGCPVELFDGPPGWLDGQKGIDAESIFRDCESWWGQKETVGNQTDLNAGWARIALGWLHIFERSESGKSEKRLS
jgi:hypothetical protein